MKKHNYLQKEQNKIERHSLFYVDLVNSKNQKMIHEYFNIINRFDVDFRLSLYEKLKKDLNREILLESDEENYEEADRLRNLIKNFYDNVVM